MHLPVTCQPRNQPTSVRLSRRTCCFGMGLTTQLPPPLAGRLEEAEYAAVAHRVNPSLAMAARCRLIVLACFLALLGLFCTITTGVRLHLTTYHYYGLLALAMGVWFVMLIVILIYLLTLRKVAKELARSAYDCQRSGVGLRMMWWPWSVHADVYPLPEERQVQQVQVQVQPTQTFAQPSPYFMASPHVMTAGGMAHPAQQQQMAPMMYYFVPSQPQSATQTEPSL